MMRSVAIAACCVTMSAAAATAQDPNQPVLGAAQPLRPGPVRIQNQVSFFLSGPTGDSEAAVKTREQARRSIYDMAAHECDLLRQTLAKDCKLEAVTANVTANRQFNQLVAPQLEGWQVNGTMTFQIIANRFGRSGQRRPGFSIVVLIPTRRAHAVEEYPARHGGTGAVPWRRVIGRLCPPYDFYDFSTLSCAAVPARRKPRSLPTARKRTPRLAQATARSALAQ